MAVLAPNNIILYAFFPFLSKKPQPPPASQPDAPQAPQDEAEECGTLRLRLALYKRIIERYKELIETSEFKSIPELRSLVTPDDKTVIQVRDGLIAEFRPYIYDRDFLKAAEKAYEFCRTEIKNEFLPVDFWLSPEDIMQLKAADEMDKAIFLCSLLLSLEDSTAKVVVIAEERMRHAVVTFEQKGKFYLLDPVHELFVSGKKEEIVEAYITKGSARQVYEFNNLEYNEW